MYEYSSTCLRKKHTQWWPGVVKLDKYIHSHKMKTVHVYNGIYYA